MTARPFRRRDALAVHDLHFGPNMTPMVDVVMVILIFFMASATFVGSEWFLKTALPKPGPAAPPKAETPAAGELKLPPARFEVTLAVETDGRVSATCPAFGSVPIGRLEASLKDLARGTTEDDIILVIRSGPEVPYGEVIRAHDAAAAAGIAKVGLMDTRE
jgi:biopolymer transport protein ExbD